jgi:multidrug transporter EmrE-like cation transporter
MTKLMAYGFVLITIVLTVVAQLLIKWQAAQAGSFPAGWGERVGFMLGLLFNPWIMAALFGAVLASCAWMLAMTRLPISIAYPMMSLTYPLVIAASWLMLGGTLSLWRVAGVALILADIGLLGIE